MDATTNAAMELAGYLAAERIEKVTLEATSDYWRICADHYVPIQPVLAELVGDEQVPDAGELARAVLV